MAMFKYLKGKIYVSTRGVPFSEETETEEIGKFNYRERERGGGGGSRKSGDCLHELFFNSLTLPPLGIKMCFTE